MSFQVWGWNADSAGCGQYRIRFPFDELIKARPDWHVEWGANIDPEYFEAELDLLVAQRVCQPVPSELFRSIAKSQRGSSIYEIDDDLDGIDPSSQQAYKFYRGSAEVEETYRNAMREATAMTVSTEHLAHKVSKYNDNVHVLTNALPNEIVEHPRVDHWEAEGWVPIVYPASSTHSGDLHGAVKYALSRIVKWTDNTHLVSIGVDYRKELGLGLKPERANMIPWQDDVNDYHAGMALYTGGIGIAPLTPSEFNRSKSALKAMEYAALGIAAVCQRFDGSPYNDFIEHGVDGLLVSGEVEWKDALMTLATDHDFRRLLISNAAKKVDGMLIKNRIQDWIDVYELYRKQDP